MRDTGCNRHRWHRRHSLRSESERAHLLLTSALRQMTSHKPGLRPQPPPFLLLPLVLTNSPTPWWSSGWENLTDTYLPGAEENRKRKIEGTFCVGWTLGCCILQGSRWQSGRPCLSTYLGSISARARQPCTEHTADYPHSTMNLFSDASLEPYANLDLSPLRRRCEQVHLSQNPSLPVGLADCVQPLIMENRARCWQFISFRSKS